METTQAGQPKFVRWAVMVGIVILFTLFVSLAISYTFNEPKYDDFCSVSPMIPDKAWNDRDMCVANGGAWTAYPQPTSEQTGYCEVNKECNQAYEDARLSHSQQAFIAYVIISIVAILGGVFLRGSSIVSAGLSYGGVLLLIVGTMQYWAMVPELGRLLLAGLGLVILVGFAYKKFKDA